MQHPLNCWKHSHQKILSFEMISGIPRQVHISINHAHKISWAFCDVTGLHIEKGYDFLHDDTQHFINQLLTFCSLLPRLDAKPSLCHNELEHKGRRSRLPD